MSNRVVEMRGLAFRFVLFALLAAAAWLSVCWPAEAQTTAPLQLEVVDTPDPARVGQTVNYRVTAKNTTTSYLNNVKITMPVPAGTTFVSASASAYYDSASCAQANDTVTCSVVKLYPANYASDGRGSVLTTDIKVRPTGTAGILAEPTAVADGVSQAKATQQTAVEAKPLVDVTLTDDQDPVRIGETITYGVKVRNAVPEDLTGVKVTVPVPDGTTFVSAAPSRSSFYYGGYVYPSCAQADGSVTCSVDKLAYAGYSDGSDSQETFYVKVKPTGAGPATIKAEAKDARGVAATATRTVTVEERPLLDVTVTEDQDPVRVGESLSYFVKVRNTLDEDVTGVKATIPVPEGTAFVSAAPSSYQSYYNGAYTTPSCSRAEGVVSCSIQRLSPSGYSDGSYSYAVFQVRVRPTAALVENAGPSGTLPYRTGTVAASATARDALGVEATGGRRTTVEERPLLGLSVVPDQDAARVGETVTYTVAAKNLVDEEVPAPVSVVVPVPEGADYVPSTTSPQCSPGEGGVSCPLGAVAAGRSQAASFKLRPTIPGSLNVSAQTRDGFGVAASAIRSIPVEERPLLELSLDEDQDPVRVGETITYSLRVRNAADEALTGVKILSPVPTGTEFVSVATADGSTNPCSEAGGLVSCDVRDLSAGAGRTYLLKVRPTGPGTVTAKAEARDTHGLPVKTSQSTSVAEKTSLAVSLVDDQESVRVGETVTYAVKVANTFEEAVGDVRLTVPVPAGTSFVSANPADPYSTNPCSEAGGVVTCAAGGIGVGSSKTFNVRVRAGGAGVVEATAEAQDRWGLPASGARTTPVEERPLLGLSVIPDQDPVRLGETFVYTIKATNAVDENVGGIRAASAVPEGTTFLSASAPCGLNGGRVLCSTQDAVGPGGSKTFDIRVRATRAGSVEVAAEAREEHGLAATARRQVAVEERSLLELSMSDDRDPVGRGEAVTYRVTARNAVDETVSGVWISNPVPSNAVFVPASNTGSLSSASCFQDAGAVRCNVGDIGASGSRSVSVMMRPNGPGIVTNRAEGHASYGLPASASEETSRVAPLPPTAQDDAASTDEDQPAKLTNVLANDSDPQGAALTLGSVTQPANGRAVCTRQGACTYTPDRDFNGEDSFTYAAWDDEGGEATGTVRITVRPVNDAPTTRDDAFATDEDAALELPVLANDADPDGDVLRYEPLSAPGNGSLTLQDGTPTYAPNRDFNGEDSFTYTASDGKSQGAPATVRVSVRPVNDAPGVSGVADQTIDEDATTAPLAFSVADAETGAAGLRVEAAADDAGLVPRSGLAVEGTGSQRTVRVSPAADRSGETRVTLTVTDAAGATATEAFVLTVRPVNDAPKATDDAAATAGDQPVTVDVLANDSDPDGDALSVSGSGQGTGGSVSCADGRCTYTARTGFSGQDSFTYTVSDGNGGSDTGTVTVAVDAPNTAPAVTGMKPGSNAKTRDKTPLVGAKVADAGGTLSREDVELYVDNKPITSFAYDAGTGALTYNSTKLAYGKHKVSIVATDARGLSGSRTWYFSVVR